MSDGSRYPFYSSGGARNRDGATTAGFGGIERKEHPVDVPVVTLRSDVENDFRLLVAALQHLQQELGPGHSLTRLANSHVREFAVKGR
jgi:hypothetical protein